jgi:hypothetical protein
MWRQRSAVLLADCEAQHPGAVAVEHAFAQCLGCGACRHDCAGNIGITSFDPMVCAM